MHLNCFILYFLDKKSYFVKGDLDHVLLIKDLSVSLSLLRIFLFSAGLCVLMA